MIRKSQDIIDKLQKSIEKRRADKKDLYECGKSANEYDVGLHDGLIMGMEHAIDFIKLYQAYGVEI